MSDPILDALNTAAQRGAAPAPGQAMSSPSGNVDPILSALQNRVAQPDAAPTPPRTFMQQVGDAASALTHHLEKLPAGMAQLAMHSQQQQFAPVLEYAPQWFKDAYKQTYGELGDTLDRQINDREVAYQKSTPNSAGAYAGATLGEVAPFLVSGPQRALAKLDSYVSSKVAPVLPQAVSKVGSRIAGGAAQGAAVGAAQPVVNPPTLSDLVTENQPQSFADQKLQQVAGGAAFGGAVRAVTGSAGALWNAGKRFVAPVANPSGYAAQQVATQLGADAPAVATDLNSAPQYVPGSIPTSAQAAADPRLVMIEKALANQNPGFKAKLAARENANNAARLQAVGDVAKTPHDLQDAIAQREAVTGPMRDFTVTNGNPVPVAGIQSQLSSLENGSLGVRPTIGGAAGSMRNAVEGFTDVTPPDTLLNLPGTATAHPAMLDAMRQNANDYLSKFAPNGVVGTQEQAAMTPVKQAIIQAINDANPGHKLSTGGWGQGMEQAGPIAPSYRDYLAEFAKRSVPVNTMQVGQKLQDALMSKALDSNGNPMATLAGYRSALARALSDSDYAIDPKAQAALEAVQSDLQRSTISNSVKAGGSDTAYNTGAGATFLKALGAAPESNAKAVAAGVGTLMATGKPNMAAGAAFGTKKLSGLVANRVGDALGELMLDPQKLAQALMVGSQPLQQAAPSAFGQLGGRLTFAAKNALLSELLKQQAPQVVGADAQPAYAD